MSEDRADKSEVVRSAGAFGIATLASRMLGMVRDPIIAALFSAASTDAFFLAFTIPNVLRRLLGEGALNAAVVPVYTEIRVKQGHAEAVRFTRALLGAWILILAAVVGAGIALAPLVVKLYAWGFSDEPAKFDLTILLTRVMFPYLMCMSLVALATGILNVHGRFFIPAFSPFFWNLAMIACAFALTPLARRWGLPDVLGIAVGVLVGGVLQVAWQLPALRSVGRLVMPSLDLGHPALKRLFRLMIPMTLGFGVYQIDVLLSKLFASFLPEGSVSYLNYGMHVVDLPQAVFFLAIGSAVLPALSRDAAEGRIESLRRSYSDALSLSLFIALPAAAALVVLAEPIASVLYFHGRFEARMLAPTALAIACMAPGIIGTAGVRVTTPAFFARGDTRTPTIIGAQNLAIYVCACLALIGPFGHLGLAAALSIAPLTQFLQLIVRLRLGVGPLGMRRVAVGAARALAGTVAMGAVLWPMARLGAWRDSSRFLPNAALLAACVATGAAVFFAVTLALRAPELRIVLDAVRSRARRS